MDITMASTLTLETISVSAHADTILYLVNSMCCITEPAHSSNFGTCRFLPCRG